MTHADALEPRRLFATGVDTTFGDGGTLPLSADYFINGVMATHGEVYVDTYHAKRGRRQIFRYTDAGVLDTTWGTNGYVVPHVIADPAHDDYDPLTMVRDPRTGGLLLGSSEDRILTVERHTADGAVDPDWGVNGRRVYTEVRANLKIASLTALPHDRVLMAFEREQQRNNSNVISPGDRKGGADDVALLMLDRRGRYDRTFNGGHAVRVAPGFYSRSTTTPITKGSITTTQQTEDFDSPTFGDVQFRSDGSLRVIVSRLAARATTTYTDDDGGVEPIFTADTASRFVASAESTAVSAEGVVLPLKSQAYVLKRGKKSGDGNAGNIYASYVPLRAVADDHNNGVAVLGNTDRGASIVRLGPGRRSRVETLALPSDEPAISATAKSPSGAYVFRTGGAGLRPKLFVVDSHLVPLRAGVFFGSPDVQYLYFTSDDANRVLTLEGTSLFAPDPDLTRYA